MNLARKDIQHNLGRFALTTVGIGMLLMIVMGMAGIYRGLIEDATLLIERIGADLWVVQRDTRGPFAEVSRVPKTLVYRVLAVPGVASAREFVYHTIQRQHDGKPMRMSVLGLSWPLDKGEWLPLIAGRPLRQNHSKSSPTRRWACGSTSGSRWARRRTRSSGSPAGWSVREATGWPLPRWDAQAIQFDTAGEAVRWNARRGSGAARPTRCSSSSPRWSNSSRARGRPAGDGRARVDGGVVRVARRGSSPRWSNIISSWGDVTVFTKAGQEELLVQGMVDKARRQLGMFRALLTMIAAIIMALILYTLTLDKLHSIALLKLIGAPNRVILGMILQQAIILGGLGYGIAYLVGQQLFPYFPRRVVLTEQDLLQLAAIVLAISVLSSLLGIWKAMRVEPNEALMG
jgi:putative ABC transport system permease protein